MAFRSVVVKSRCKLEYSGNYLVCLKGDEEKRILLDEIKMIIIHSTQVSITTTLITQCINKKIKVLFADEKHNLVGEVTPYRNNYYANRRLNDQLSFKDEIKGFLWQQIVKEKITNQSLNLKLIKDNETFLLLQKYILEVEEHDITNREGLSAKAYFRALFGENFTRNNDLNVNNIFLNYGYTIILSSFNRAIKSLGYYTELGIHHAGDANPFNLSCDFMEPLRPLVDSLIIKNEINETNFKDKFIDMLSFEVQYDGKNMYLDNAIENYCENLFLFLKTGDKTKIMFIEYEQ